MVGNEDSYRQAMNQGHSAAWDQNWERAAEFYRQALQENPDSPQALTSLGLALFEQGKYEEALSLYSKAAEISPDDPLPVEKMADIYERTGRLKYAADQSMKAAELYLKIRDVLKAMANWTRVVRLFPENLSAHTRLALVHERLGHTQQAITEHLAVASLLQHSGKLEEALKTAKHAQNLDSQNNEAHQALALLRANKSLPKPMRQRGGTGALRMARVQEMGTPEKKEKRQENPDPILEAQQRALTTLAGLLFDVTDESEADTKPMKGIRALTQGISGGLTRKKLDFGKISLHLGQAIDLQTHGDDEQATDELSRAISAGLDIPAAYFNLGFLLYQGERKESAQRNLARAVQHADYSLAARLLIGEYLRERGRLKDATGEYLEALKVADMQVAVPELADEIGQLYEPLIEAHQQTENDEQLAQLCDNIAELLVRPNWREHLKKARAQLPSASEGEAPVPLAEMISEARSSQVVEVMARIDELARGGHLRSAMEEAYMILPQAPTYLPLHIRMGELMLHQERTEEAIVKFTAVAQTYSARGESNRARQLYQRVVEISPMDLAARTRLIDQLVVRGDIEDALDEYMNLADVYYRLAELDMARSTYEGALRLAQQSQVDRSWSIQVLLSMADIDLQRLDWRKAVRVYEQLRTIEPEDEKVRSSLVELNMRLGQEPNAQAELDNYLSYLTGNAKEAQALAYLEKLIEEHPDYVFARRRLAEAYQQAARNEDAVAQWDTVGEMLYDAGNQEGAKEAVRAILMLDPPNKEHYRTLLQKLGG